MFRNLIVLLTASTLYGQDVTLFAGGITSMLAFSPDGKTVYFGKAGKSWNIVVSRLENGQLGEPRPLAFSSAEYSDGNPFLSPDGRRMFFWSTRPVNGQPRKQSALWAVDKEGTGWGTPRDLGPLINTEEDPSANGAIAANGALYFSTKRPDAVGDLDLYRAAPAGDGYAKPENLGPVINSPQHEYDVYIAPDESFILFSSDRPGGAGNADLYVSTRRNGTWTPPRNLGPKVNSAGTEMFPSISPDGKYLFFTRLRVEKPGIYRMDLAAVGLKAPSR